MFFVGRTAAGDFSDFMRCCRVGCFYVVLFFRYNTVSAGKEAELNRLQADYANLQGEVLAFADHLNRVVSEIDDNQQAIRSLQQEIADSPVDEGKVRKADSISASEKLTAGDKAGQLAEEAGRLKMKPRWSVTVWPD